MKSNYKAAIDKWFDAHAGQMLEDLSALIAINSVRTQPGEGMPYGPGCTEVLAKAMEFFARDGFNGHNFENHVVTAELNDKEPCLGILAHLDTVGVTDGWQTNPFEMVCREQVLYGRGVADDKGPAAAAYYAMKAVRDIAPELSKGCRLILGAAEETGEPDLEYYETRQKYPPMVFTPDGDYPVVNFEKGRYAPCFGAEWESSPRGKRIIYITGGDTANIVPQKAQASVSGFELDEVSEYVQKYSKKCGLSITCAVSGDNIVINAVGKSAHASTPELGVNPQTALLEMLGDMPLDNSPCVNAVRALSRLFPHGDVSGKAFKIDRNDADTGNLTLNFGVLKLDEKGFYANCDIRMPRGATRENTADTVNAALTACGFELKDTSDFTQYHYTPADGQFVKTLLDVYENYTVKKGECLAIGGGTYVHNIDGGVAFGCVMPGYDTRMHGDDERMPVEDLIISAKMFAQVIIELCM